MSDNITVARLRAELDALKRRVSALEAVEPVPEPEPVPAADPEPLPEPEAEPVEEDAP